MKRFAVVLSVAAVVSLSGLWSTRAPPAPEADLPTHDAGAWMSRVQRQLSRERADVHVDGDALDVEHRSGLSVVLDPTGAATLSRGGEAPQTLHTARLRQGGVAREFVDAAPRVGPCRRGANPDCVHRAEVEQGPVTTWWEHHPDGIEQGWEIAAPVGLGELRIEVEATALVSASPDALHLGDEGSGYEARGLAAWDALGRALPVRAEAGGDGFVVVVDADDATYPVTVDPIWTPWGWTRLGPVDSGFGASVALGGDVNGDGYEDALVGAPGYDVPGGARNVGRVYLYLGGPAGLSTASAQTFTGRERGEAFGAAVVFLGDTNGDGYEDAAIGADNYDGGIVDQGAVYVLHGDGARLGPNPAVRLTGGMRDRHYGGTLAAAGDVNGDGLRDLVAGVSHLNATDSGLVRLFFGAPGGIASPANQTWGRNSGYRLFGASLAGGRDLDGDGYDEVVIGVPTSAAAGPDPKVEVYRGGPAGPGAAPSWTWQNGGVAYAVGLGDVNGDGSSDLLVSDSANLAVFHGGGPLARSPDQSIYLDEMVVSLASGGDLTGDGMDDVLVGTPGADQSEGSVLLMTGAVGGLAAAPARIWRGESYNWAFGGALAVGDVNADLIDDALVGAAGVWFTGETGQIDPRRTLIRGNAFWMPGAPGGPASLAPEFTFAYDHRGARKVPVGDVNGDGVLDMIELGYNVSWVPVDGRPGASVVIGDLFTEEQSALCDVNGDGFDDLVLGGTLSTNGVGTDGAWWLPGGPAGLVGPPIVLAPSPFAGPPSITCAGDLNADGFEDLLRSPTAVHVEVWVGGPGGPVATGLELRSRVGGRAIVSATAAWIADVDVNGDGMDDVVLADDGANTGMIGVWYGSPGGIRSDADAAWRSTSLTALFLGERIAAAGDVNGDGYQDVLVTSLDHGAPLVHLVYGSAAGLVPALAATWASQDPLGTLEHEAPFSGAGDVDGDGFGDVVIGENVVQPIDRPYGSMLNLYRGHAQAPSATPDWRGPYGLQPQRIVPLGDIDADGLADVLVTDNVPQGGSGVGLFVLRGAPSGLTVPGLP